MQCIMLFQEKIIYVYIRVTCGTAIFQDLATFPNVHMRKLEGYVPELLVTARQLKSRWRETKRVYL